MSEIYKLSGFQQELDKAERFFTMHLTKQELKRRLDEIERLHSIIKEVREYMENQEYNDDNWVDYELLIEPIVILEILDKENKE